MANTHENAVATVAGIEGYRIQFEKIFPGEGVTIDNIGKAIATFERAVVTGPTPYDYREIVPTVESQFDEEEIEEIKEESPEMYAKYAEAKRLTEGIDEGVWRGRDLFFSDGVGCTACHAGANFSDEQYHNLGVGMDVEELDLGRSVVTGEDKDTGAFKTPTVRNVAMTGPYMHDGSQATLEEVVDWYGKGGHPNEHLSDKVKKIELTDQEKQDLVAFMKIGLNGSFPPVELGRLPQ
jgi:cytochrome c peroxidase